MNADALRTRGRAGSWRRRMVPRDARESHRGVSPLELLVDLCFVVAVASAASELRRLVAGGHVVPGLLGYLLIFFLIWWSWVSFTWFASAYDTDDVPFRLLALLQTAGVLILAAGVPDALAHHEFATVIAGYAIMRAAMVAQWMRAAAEHPTGRSAALRYVAGIGFCLVVALTSGLLPHPWGSAGLGLLIVAELAVPVWAESRGRPTSWHPEHINERYGMFTMIVLGQCVAAVTVAVHAAISDHGLSASLLALAVGSMALLFGLWWSYFNLKADAAETLRVSRGSAAIWAYGHYVVFAALAALGAGLEVVVETVERGGPAPAPTAAFAVAVPVAVYLVVVGVLHDPVRRAGLHRQSDATVTAILSLAVAGSTLFLPLWSAVLAMGGCLTIQVAVDVVSTHRDSVSRT
jgi:low temperature requirement protein LtrA